MGAVPTGDGRDVFVHRVARRLYDRTLFFGLQAILKEHLSKPVASWRSGYAAARKVVHAGSIPADASSSQGLIVHTS